MLFGERFPFYCKSHTEHTDTLCGQNAEIVPHRKHNTYPLQSPTGKWCLGKQLLFIVRTIRNTQIYCVGRMQSLYHTGNPLLLQYKAQPVNAHWRSSRCLLWETYGTHRYNLWAECRDCTSQGTHYVRATNPNRLMLLGKRITVYCENHTEHTDTLCGQNAEFVPHRKHITCKLQSPTDLCCLRKHSLFILRNIQTQRNTVWTECRVCTSEELLRLRYKAQPVNYVWGNSLCLLWEPYLTHRYNICVECRNCTSQETHYFSATKPNR
jgi:hypothetical protein